MPPITPVKICNWMHVQALWWRRSAKMPAPEPQRPRRRHWAALSALSALPALPALPALLASPASPALPLHRSWRVSYAICVSRRCRRCSSTRYRRTAWPTSSVSTAPSRREPVPFQPRRREPRRLSRF